MGFEVIEKFDRSLLEILPILTESLVVALPASHQLANQPHIYLRDLATEKLILPSIAEFPFYQQFIDYCQQIDCKLTIVQNVQATWLVTILSLVVAEIGIAILPSNVQNLHRQGVIYRTIEDANLTRHISVIWRKNDLSIVLSQLIEIVRNRSLKDS